MPTRRAGEGPGPAPVASSQASPAPAAPSCPATPAKFTCPMRTRIAAVQAFLRHRPGVVGVVLRDRSTGAVWENAHAHTHIYMASTSKLAMAVALHMGIGAFLGMWTFGLIMLVPAVVERRAHICACISVGNPGYGSVVISSGLAVPFGEIETESLPVVI